MVKRWKSPRPYEHGGITPEEARAFLQEPLTRGAAGRDPMASAPSVWDILRAQPEILDQAEALAPARSQKRRRIVEWTLRIVAAVGVGVLLFRVL